ncbi:hypothetical protein B5X24_HaOG215991 [Helicoverpa armigera]|nr:hypothetical protein B5X24_HaOG215991 [Helicoverpa armigera]
MSRSSATPRSPGGPFADGPPGDLFGRGPATTRGGPGVFPPPLEEGVDPVVLLVAGELKPPRIPLAGHGLGFRVLIPLPAARSWPAPPFATEAHSLFSEAYVTPLNSPMQRFMCTENIFLETCHVHIWIPGSIINILSLQIITIDIRTNLNVRGEVNKFAE